MAREIRKYEVVVPTTVPATAPHKVHLTFPPLQVSEVSIRVPPGPRGEVGFALGNAAQPVIPWQPTAWIVTDDDEIVFPLTGYTDSGTWWVLAYNTGTYQHTLYLTFYCTLTTAAGGTGRALAPSTLSVVPVTSTVGATIPSGTTLPIFTTGAPAPVTYASVPPLATLPSATPVPTPTLPTATLPTAPTLTTGSLPGAPTIST